MYKEGVDFQNDDRNWHDSEMYKERGWGCCCECSNQKTLNGHPWADGNSISTVVGYVCTAMSASTGSVVLGTKHGCCELFSKKSSNEFKTTDGDTGEARS